jgi:hypothetical protein
MVAEAQVFLPERAEFDEVINKTIVKELKLKTLRFKSLPITLKDVDAQLKALDLAKDLATRESSLDEVNTVSGMELKLAEMPQPDSVTETLGDGTTTDPNKKTVSQIHHSKLPASTKPPMPSAPQPTPKEPKVPTIEEKAKEVHAIETAKQKARAPFQKKAAIELIELAHDYMGVKGLIQKADISPERQLLIEEEVESLDGDDLKAFNTLLAQYAYGHDDPDLVFIAAHTR